MSKAVRFHREARSEYREAESWYEGHQAGLGLDFLDAVDSTLERIAAMPRIGSQELSLQSRSAVRTFPVRDFPYRIVYTDTPTTIYVLAIAHTSRRPGYWRGRA